MAAVGRGTYKERYIQAQNQASNNVLGSGLLKFWKENVFLSHSSQKDTTILGKLGFPM